MIEWIYSADYAVLDFIREYIAGPFLDGFMVCITTLGDKRLIWVVIAVIMICFNKTRPYGFLLLAAIITAVTVGDHIIKPLVGRIRPCNENFYIELLIRRPNGFSFPSGHTGSSFAAATVICFSDKRLGIPAVLLASLIAFSRVYLYMHFPSDILGGIVLGVGVGLLFGMTYRYLLHKNELKKSC